MDQILGGYDFRGRISVEQAWNIGKALAEWLPQSGGVAVCGRQSSPLFEAVVEGLRLQGRNTVSLMDGDRKTVTDYVSSQQLAGGVRVAIDDMDHVSTIELFRENGQQVDEQSGLKEIADMVTAGNFVPAVKKGELSALA